MNFEPNSFQIFNLNTEFGLFMKKLLTRLGLGLGWPKETYCYNGLDLYHAQKISQVFITCFPSSFKQEWCLKKVTNSWPRTSNLLNLFSTQYSCSQELGKSNSHLQKLFRMANLYSFSNKILFLVKN